MRRPIPSLVLTLPAAFAVGCASDQPTAPPRRQPRPPAATRADPPAVAAPACGATAVLTLDLATSQVGRPSAFFVSPSPTAARGS